MLTLSRIARVTTDEPGLAHTTRAIRAPDPRLAPLLSRELLGFELMQAQFQTMLEAPRPALTLMIDLDGAIHGDGRRLPGAWLGGLRDRYTVVAFAGRYASIDLKLTPIGALRILGRPLSCLGGEGVALEDVFGAAGRELALRVRDAADWDRRFDLVERFLLARAAAGAAPTPAVERAHARLWQSAGRVRIETLAAELSCSRRYLTERFGDELGMTPKALGRLIRFQHVCGELRRAPRRWADIAAGAGFCDQPHLNREFRELAGTTPADFLARCLPAGGVVGDGLPFVQDTDR